MRELASPSDLLGLVGQLLGTSPWITVDQATIDAFAQATGDHQWIHVDVERAKREMPGGRTIAHGYLTLSLLPRMMQEVLSVGGRSRTINYGSNRVRFSAPVPSGARVRLHLTLKEAESIAGAVRFVYDCKVEIEGETKPALVAETIQIAYL